MKAVVHSLAPFPCFHPKSHPSSLQGSPREQRHPTSFRGDGNKAETSLHSFLLLIPRLFSISAASGQPHTQLSSAAFRVSSSSSSRPGRESSEFLGDALTAGGEHSSLSGSYNISHYVPVVKSNGFIIFYATNSIALEEAAAAFYHRGTFSSPKLDLWSCLSVRLPQFRGQAPPASPTTAQSTACASSPSLCPHLLSWPAVLLICSPSAELSGCISCSSSIPGVVIPATTSLPRAWLRPKPLTPPSPKA